MAQQKVVTHWICGTCEWKNSVVHQYCENCNHQRAQEGCIIQIFTKQELLNDFQQHTEKANQSAKGAGAGLYN